MELRGKANLWIPIAFAAVVSEAAPSPLPQLRESLQQMSSQLDHLGMPEHSVRGVFALTVAYFPVLQALLVLCAFAAYLAATRTFSLRGFLCGLPTAFLVFSVSFMGVISLLLISTFDLPQPIFYYGVLRPPMFFGLVLALWVAHYQGGLRNTNLTSKLA